MAPVWVNPLFKDQIVVTFSAVNAGKLNTPAKNALSSYPLKANAFLVPPWIRISRRFQKVRVYFSPRIKSFCLYPEALNPQKGLLLPFCLSMSKTRASFCRKTWPSKPAKTVNFTLRGVLTSQIVGDICWPFQPSILSKSQTVGSRVLVSGAKNWRFTPHFMHSSLFPSLSQQVNLFSAVLQLLNQESHYLKEKAVKVFTQNSFQGRNIGYNLHLNSQIVL